MFIIFALPLLLAWTSDAQGLLGYIYGDAPFKSMPTLPPLGNRLKQMAKVTGKRLNIEENVRF